MKMGDEIFEHVAEDMRRTLKGYDIHHEPETFTQAFYQAMKKNGSYS